MKLLKRGRRTTQPLADIWLDLRQTLHWGLKPKGFPVLLYHALATDENEICGNQRERKYWGSAKSLSQHLDVIGGDRVSPLDELWMPCRDAGHVSGQLAITFDDGHLSDYEVAFPLLDLAGAPATFFLNTATVATKGFLAWNQILEMQRHGMSFQSHGHEHLNMTQLPADSLKLQLQRSKERLEDRLGRAVRFFAAPFGEVSERLLYTARLVGYDAVCTTRNWPAWPGDCFINRICMYQSTCPDDVARLASLDRSVFLGRMLRSALLYIPRRVFPRLPLSQPALDAEKGKS